MQTTLLGLAIAFILALLAALIGPHFVDWSRFRPQFEAEASRVIGLPVRVDGGIDARLLPSPSLRLRTVAVGARFDDNNASAEELDVEFSLGALLRGEWRASDMSLSGLVVELALDERGRMLWNAKPSSVNIGALTIDRLNVNGAVSLRHAAGATPLRIDDIAFSGDVRAQAGAMRGEGAFAVGGVRYPFRLSAGRAIDGAGARMHLSIDPGAEPFAADLDGVLTFIDASPRFEGSASLSRPAPPRPGASGEGSPWRVAARVKADPQSVLFEQLDAAYGPETSALRLTGVADLSLGGSPRAHAVLSARQLDADKWLAENGGGVAPRDLLTRLPRLLASLPAAPIPAQIEVSAALVSLGGRPVQDIVADLRVDGSRWGVDRLELRAPGATRLVASGAIAEAGAERTFKGAVSADSSDPGTLLAWLKGHGPADYRIRRPVRLRGEVTLGGDRFAIDALKAEVEGQQVDGRLSVSGFAGDAVAFDAAISAPRLDLDVVSALAREFGAGMAWPQEARIALDLGEATLAGQTVRPVTLRASYDRKAFALERLRIGGADDLTFDGKGAFDWETSAGQLQLGASSPSLPRLVELVAPLAPGLARRLAALPVRAGNVWLGGAVDLDRPTGERAALRMNLDLRAPGFAGGLNASATPALATLRSFDTAALTAGDVTIEARLAAERGPALLGAIGLDGLFAAGGGAADLDVKATGPLRGPLRIAATLTGEGLEAEAAGVAEPWRAEPAATLDLAVRKANASPFAGLDAATALPLTLISRAVVADGAIRLENLDATLAGSRLRGRMAIRRGDAIVVDGEIGADALAVAPLVAVLVGAAARSEDAPLGGGPLEGWRGKIAFEALRAATPLGDARALSGVLRAEGATVRLDNLKATFAGGKADGELAWSRTGAGMTLSGRLRLVDIDAAALSFPGLLRSSGKGAVELALAGSGRSGAALVGALNGQGRVSLGATEIEGANPAVFDLTARAHEAGGASDSVALREMAQRALAAAPFRVSAVEAPLVLKDGQLRIVNVALREDRARLDLAGGYDLASGQLDLRAGLAADERGQGQVGRADVQIFLYGSPAAPARTLDISGLSAWLNLRAIERETRRLEMLERGERQATAPASVTPLSVPPVAGPAPPQLAPPQPAMVPSARDAVREPRRRDEPRPAVQAPPPAAPSASAESSAPPLPPAIEIRPAPGAQRQPRPRQPLVLTPDPARVQ